MKAHAKTFAATAAGAVVMALLGWTLAGESSSQSRANATGPSERTGRQHSLSAHRKGPPEQVRAYLDAIRHIGSPDKRLSATVNLANSLPTAELGGWIENDWFDIRDGCDFDFFTQIVLQRWQTEDPAEYLTYARKHQSPERAAMLAAWAARNPQEVCAYFKDNPDYGLEINMLGYLAHTSPAQTLQCLLALTAGDSHLSCDWNGAEVMRSLSASDPEAFFKALDSLPSNWRAQAETAYAGEQLKASFSDEIRRLWDQPGGWAIFNEAVAGDGERGWDSNSARRLLEELPNLPQEWLRHLDQTVVINYSNYQDAVGIDWEAAGVPADVAARLRGKVLTFAQRENPDLAVELLAAGEVDANSRNSVFESMLWHFNSDSPEAEAVIATFGPEENREAARQYLAKKNADQQGDGPDEHITFVGEDSTPDTPSHTLVASQDWKTRAGQAGVSSPDQVAEMIADFRALPDDQKASAALGITQGIRLGQSGESPVGEALLYLLNHPEEARNSPETSTRNLISLSSGYAVSMGDQNPAAAATWVGSLPDGEPKLWAEKNLAVNWGLYDPEAVERWVGSLPPSSRVQVLEYLKQPRR